MSNPLMLFSLIVVTLWIILLAILPLFNCEKKKRRALEKKSRDVQTIVRANVTSLCSVRR